MTINVHHGDCCAVLAGFADNSVDACVTDPPYHLTSIVKRFGSTTAAPAKSGKTGAYARAAKGFMGQTWDGGDVAFDRETWRAVYRVMKPGAHLIAFSGTRTYHRMACAIEDAGFEIRDQLAWLYGSGFPKSHNVSKGIDRHNGDARPVIGTERLTNDIRGGALLDIAHDGNRPAFERDVTSAASAAWDGWGSALKPALEPIVLARKPLSEKSIAANVLRWGVGALNIDGCRIATDEALRTGAGVIPMRHDPAVPRGRAGEASASERYAERGSTDFAASPGPRGGDEKGRWPANVIHDGSDEVLAAFPETESGSRSAGQYGGMGYHGAGAWEMPDIVGDSGSAARFFYSPKAGPLDRMGSEHPTVKPVDLMRWLCRLVTPPGGTILDLFAGSGTTGIAAMAEGFNAELIDLEAKHVADIERKLALLRGEGRSRFAEQDERKAARANIPAMPLFGEQAA